MDIKSALEVLIQSTRQLHIRFNAQPLGPSDETRLDRRIRMQIEELGEFARAVSRTDVDNLHEEATDNLVVALGTVLLLAALPSAQQQVIDRILYVAEKNDAKTPETHHVVKGKIVKRESV